MAKLGSLWNSFTIASCIFERIFIQSVLESPAEFLDLGPIVAFTTISSSILKSLISGFLFHLASKGPKYSSKVCSSTAWCSAIKSSLLPLTLSLPLF